MKGSRCWPDPIKSLFMVLEDEITRHHGPVMEEVEAPKKKVAEACSHCVQAEINIAKCSAWRGPETSLTFLTCFRFDLISPEPVREAFAAFNHFHPLTKLILYRFFPPFFLPCNQFHHAPLRRH